MKRIQPAELGNALTEIRKKLVEPDFVLVLQKLAMDGMNCLHNRTPVDTGYLIGNWRQVPVAITIGDKVSLQNNTEYACYVETGAGKGHRPQPMVEPCAVALTKKAEDLSRRLSKKKYNV